VRDVADQAKPITGANHLSAEFGETLVHLGTLFAMKAAGKVGHIASPPLRVVSPSKVITAMAAIRFTGRAPQNFRTAQLTRRRQPRMPIQSRIEIIFA
jgi:hypothetical protein